MPHVINGIGTWYWGKRNMRVRRGGCQFCGKMADLRSYDSTLFFVVFFMPIVPLKKVRVMEECSACKRHRVANLKTWEKTKLQVMGEALKICRENPRDAAKVRQALATCIAFEDEATFAQIAAMIGETMAEDAEVQDMLGSAYAFFGHSDMAELSFRTSLNLKDDAEVAMRLGVHLMRAGQAEEGWRLVQPLVTAEQADRTGTAMLAVMALQAEGKHEAALGVLDHLVGVQPGMAKDKEVLKLRKLSEKNRASGKKIKTDLVGGGTTGMQERRVLSRVPMVFAALVLLGLVGGFLWGSWYKGAHRTVFVVSGLDRTSTVTVGPHTMTLNPYDVRQMVLPEGIYGVQATMDGRTGGPETVTLSTSFFSRLFERRTFVINADRLALIEWERAVYAPASVTRPSVQPEMKLYVGEALYDFTGIDYEFDAFPPQLSVNRRSGTMSKERIDNVQSPGTIAAWSTVNAAIGDDAAKAWVKRAAAVRANDPDVFYVLLSTCKPEEALGILRPLLAERPVLVEPHRAYQEVMERTAPEHDLAAEYRAMLGTNPDDSAVQYLLGRVVRNVGEAEELFKRATKGPRPVARAHMAIAYQRLAGGRFKEGLAALREGIALAPEDAPMREMETDFLLGLGKLDEVLSRQEYLVAASDMDPGTALSKAALLGARGKKDEAAKWMGEYQGVLQQEGGTSLGETWRRCAEATTAYAAGDAGPLARLGESAPGEALDRQAADSLGLEGLTLRSAITGGRFAEVAKEIGDNPDNDTWVMHLLVSIAGSTTGDEATASEHMEAGTKALAKGSWEHREVARWLEQTEAPDLVAVMTLPMTAREKAVALTALGIRHEGIRGPVFELAGKLNFDPGFPRLLLKAAIEK